MASDRVKIGESKITRNSVFLPKSVRIALDLKDGDVVEWWVEGGKIVIRKKGSSQ